MRPDHFGITPYVIAAKDISLVKRTDFFSGTYDFAVPLKKSVI